MRYVPLPTLVVAAVVLLSIGLALGIPGGLAYHVALYRALGRRGALPARWWLSPTDLHAHLDPEDRPRVLGFFAVGAAGFVVAMLGCGALLAAAFAP